MCRGGKEGQQEGWGLERGQPAGESESVFLSDASAAVGPLGQHRDPWPCLGSSRVRGGVGWDWGGAAGVSPTAARVPPS